MTEKKNCCVDGKCTSRDFNECKHMRGLFYSYCASWMFPINGTDQCSSKDANAEYQESQK